MSLRPNQNNPSSITTEVNVMFNSMRGINQLAHKLTIPHCKTYEEFELAMDGKYINVIDLVRETNPPIHETRAELLRYSYKSRKIFPKRKIRSKYLRYYLMR
jgi:hypothetical protein